MWKPEVTKLRSTTLKDSDGYGWIITCYDDITKIEYYERENGTPVIKHTYDFTAGYDLAIFKEAIRLRGEENKGV